MIGIYWEWKELSLETAVGLAPWCDCSAWWCLEHLHSMGSREAWDGVQITPGHSKYEEYAYTWSLGTPSGTDPNFLSGHFLLHC